MTNITTTAFNWEDTLEQGNKVIETHFIPWLQNQQVEFIDCGGSVLDRKFGIDGTIVNTATGKAKTVQVKKDSKIGKTGNIYLETTKIKPTTGNKQVRAQLIYFIDTETNTMYSMLTSELQENFEELIEGLQLKMVQTVANNGQRWAKGGHAVPLERFRETLSSFKEIKLA